jgi:hypothetical protein
MDAQIRYRIYWQVIGSEKTETKKKNKFEFNKFECNKFDQIFQINNKISLNLSDQWFRNYKIPTSFTVWSISDQGVRSIVNVNCLK